ncbi:ATP-binding protein [Nannocystis sp. ILAH1]|uniref:ATP-binding protein n=1 Tax=Nannocystis sp. ILAH1 TaxID=2996789 RepID=UPI002271FF26|nr:ATP-binding protein [Nannocystis sp. ILAH1]MCY0993106.1 ATP-binding protein [Nannocystis sp. ILAH1]
MMNQQTMERLKEMRLNGLAAAWLEQQSRTDYGGLGFDERLGLLVDSEWMSRQNARLKRNLKEARLKLGSACLEDLDYDDRRELDKPLIRQLATCNWVAQHQNIAITGPTGTGKSFLACALAQHALRRRYRAMYRRTSRLFDELALARADGTYQPEVEVAGTKSLMRGSCEWCALKFEHSAETDASRVQRALRATGEA